jgi:hypothetical protein
MISLILLCLPVVEIEDDNTHNDEDHNRDINDGVDSLGVFKEGLDTPLAWILVDHQLTVGDNWRPWFPLAHSLIADSQILDVVVGSSQTRIRVGKL